MSTPPYPQARANPMQRRTVGSVWWSSASEPLRITQASRGLSESHTRTSRYRHVRHGLKTAHDSRQPVVTIQLLGERYHFVALVGPPGHVFGASPARNPLVEGPVFVRPQSSLVCSSG